MHLGKNNGRFAKLALLSISLFMLGGVALAFSQISVSRDAKEEGDGSTSIEFTFPDATLSYRAKADGSGLVDKDSWLYGLSFQRPLSTNGGWSLWDFLKVKVRAQGELIPVVEQYMLTNADILEDQQRVLIAFDWRVAERGIDLRILLAWYPEQPDWIFGKVKCAGEDVSLGQVELTAYPGNSAGPEERERWFATDKAPGSQLSVQMEEISADTSGLVFFNRFAQEDSGCLLVLGGGSEGVKVGGTYGVGTQLDFPDGQRETQFALGGFVLQSAEEVIRVFQMEGARNTLNYLNSIDWTPNMDKAAHDRLLRDAENLVKEDGNESSRAEFHVIKAEYDASLESGNNSDLLGSMRKVADLRLRLIEGELAKLK